jgi:hypothetical protein
MQHDRDHDFCRHALARQVLDECERRGLRVWQQFGAAYIARSVRGRLASAPKHWQRVVEALSYEIACVLDWDSRRGRYRNAALRDAVKPTTICRLFPLRAIYGSQDGDHQAQRPALGAPGTEDRQQGARLHPRELGDRQQRRRA